MQPHFHRLARMELRRVGGARARLDHVHELAAALVAVDDGRRVLGGVRDIAERGGHVGRAAVAMHEYLAARRERADRAFRHEKAQLHVLRRQHLHDRTARLHPFADTIERVVDEPVARRGHALLVELPLRLRERGLRGLDVGGLCGDLRRAAGQVGDAHLIAQLAHLRGGAGGLRARVVELCLGDAARAPLRLVARELERGFVRVGFGLRELRFGHAHFGRALARLQIGELRLRRYEPVTRLVERGGFADGFEREYRRGGGDLLAAPDVEFRERAGLRRGEIDVLAFDITLIDRRFVARAGGQRSDRNESEGDGRGARCPAMGCPAMGDGDARAHERAPGARRERARVLVRVAASGPPCSRFAPSAAGAPAPSGMRIAPASSAVT
ncbi:hypothetical protein PT2222_300116 [Paraburkholderia tropica]